MGTHDFDLTSIQVNTTKLGKATRRLTARVTFVARIGVYQNEWVVPFSFAQLLPDLRRDGHVSNPSCSPVLGVVLNLTFLIITPTVSVPHVGGVA